MAKFFVGFIIFAYSPIRNPDMQEVMLTIGWADLKSFLSVGYILFVIVTIAVIIHDKREPVKALSWIIVISLLPVVGFVFYIVFGRNHRKQKLFNRKELHDLEQIDALSRQQIYEINHPSLLHKSEISDHRDTITLLLNSNKALLTVHNRVRVLNDGAETFDEIRRALRQARESIHMEYYIIEDDELGREIADILIAKAAEGVEVRLIYDDVVGMLQIVFITDWFFVTKKLLADYDKYLPKTHVRDETMIQIVTSGPDSDWASIMQAFFSAISHAQHHIYISSPYFLPNEAILTAVKVASLSGIDVRIMIPSRSDSKIVYWASRSYIGELIEANVKVYLYRKGFNHSKLIMIDGRFASVGTANMDIRSFEDNFEVSAILYDRAITESLEADFLRDLERSRLVTREYWESRPLLHNMYEAMSRLFSPLL